MSETIAERAARRRLPVVEVVSQSPECPTCGGALAYVTTGQTMTSRPGSPVVVRAACRCGAVVFRWSPV